MDDAIAGWTLNGWDDLSPTTTRRYEVIWRLHVRESIGRRRLVDLTPWDFECYFRELKAAGQSQSSVRYARAMLHRACRLARKWSNGALPNPVADAELPWWRHGEQAVRGPSVEEVRAIMAAADAGEDRRLWLFIGRDRRVGCPEGKDMRHPVVRHRLGAGVSPDRRVDHLGAGRGHAEAAQDPRQRAAAGTGCRDDGGAAVPAG